MSGLFFLFIFSLIFQFNLDEFIDITPSTAILEMLGEIDFTALQCICELVDNSLDAFIQQKEKKILEFDSNNKIKIQSQNRIIIKIPKLKKNPMNLNRLDLEDKFISVEDASTYLFFTHNFSFVFTVCDVSLLKTTSSPAKVTLPSDLMRNL